MAHRNLIGGTSYDTKGGRCLVNGTGYAIKKGRTLIAGTGYDVEFAPDVFTLHAEATPANANTSDTGWYSITVYDEGGNEKAFYALSRTNSSISRDDGSTVKTVTSLDAELEPTDYLFISCIIFRGAGANYIYLNGTQVAYLNGSKKPAEYTLKPLSGNINMYTNTGSSGNNYANTLYIEMG